MKNSQKYLLERALQAVELIEQIRCHPRRHDMEREWLTKADAVIGYWERHRTAQSIRAALAAMDEPVRDAIERAQAAAPMAAQEPVNADSWLAEMFGPGPVK